MPNVRSLTRRVFFGLIATGGLVMAGWFKGSIRDGDELVIVNGWILRKSDLRSAADDL